MSELGPKMAAEMREGAAVFEAAARQPVSPIARPGAIYTFARGSSDTVANVLSYAFMERLGIPMTSLPPSVFSIGKGVSLGDALALVISQSGASEDLVACAKGADRSVAITNVEGSAVEQESDATIRINAGPENAVPATKTVLGALGAGLALLHAIDGKTPDSVARVAEARLPDDVLKDLARTLGAARHIYVLGRQCSYGVAQEIALKLKETSALHAEAYSASEVLHGPIQLATNPMVVLVLDAGDEASQPSLDRAETRFRSEGTPTFRIGPSDLGVPGLTGVEMAAALLYALYPLVHRTAARLGIDPDAPDKLAKVTRTE